MRDRKRFGQTGLGKLLKKGITAGATVIGGPAGGMAADRVLNFRRSKGAPMAGVTNLVPAGSELPPVPTGIIQDIENKIGVSIWPQGLDKVKALWVKHMSWAMPVLMVTVMAAVMYWPKKRGFRSR